MTDLPFSFSGDPAVTAYGDLIVGSAPALEDAVAEVWGWLSMEARDSARASLWPEPVAGQIKAWWLEEDTIAVGVTERGEDFHRLEYGSAQDLPTAAVRHAIITNAYLASLRLQESLDRVTGYGTGTVS